MIQEAMFLFKNIQKQVTGLSMQCNSIKNFTIMGNIDTVAFNTRYTFCKISFFLSTSVEWNNLNKELRNYESYCLFRCNILNFIRSSLNTFFNYQKVIGRKFANTLRLGLTHLQKYVKALKPFLNCGMSVDFSTYFLFLFLFFS